MAVFLNMDKIKKYKSLLIELLDSIKYYILNHKSLCVLILTTLLVILFWLDGLIIGSVLYLMILLRELLNHKIEKDKLDSLDIHYFETANRDLEDPLDGYIDLCLNEYMLLYRAYKNLTYIRQQEEAQIRQEVLDIMASNMSTLMQTKLEMYYGKGRLPGIMARKCFIKVALYVANNNKLIYQEEGENTKK